MYQLDESELARIREAIRSIYAIPFIDDIEDYIWEAIFSYARGVPLVDPFNKVRGKKLFDLVDPGRGIGWSAKTLDVNRSCSPGSQFELVIQRADIFSKGDALGFGTLSLESKEQRLGDAIITHWLRKADADSTSQGITDPRICILLKMRGGRDKFIFYEDAMHRFGPKELYWKWTNSHRRGLQGFRKDNDERVYRWYRSGAQLFECFTLPLTVQAFEVSTSRLPPAAVIAALSELLGNIP
jgi:hypothetical protein